MLQHAYVLFLQQTPKPYHYKKSLRITDVKLQNEQAFFI